MSLIKQLAAAPLLLSARLLPCIHQEVLSFEITFVIKDYSAGVVPNKYTYEALCQCNLGTGQCNVLGAPRQIEEQPGNFKSYSASRRWMAVGTMRRISEKKIPILQVYRDGQMVLELDLQREHGEFCTDGIFGHGEWEETRGLFIYQAEAISPLEASPKATISISSDSYERYREEGHWGEKMATRKNPKLFLLTIDAKTVEQIETSAEVTPASARIVGEHVYFVSYKAYPRKFGLYLCFNRPTVLQRWHMQSKQIETVYDGLEEGRTVRFLVRGVQDKLHFLRDPLGGSHFHASDVCTFDPETGHVTIAASQVFMETFESWSPFTNGIRINHFIHSYKTISQIEPSNHLRGLCDRNEQKSWQLLDAHDGRLLAKCSAPNQIPILQLGTEQSDGQIQWRHLDVSCLRPSTPILSKLAEAAFEVISVSETIQVVFLHPAIPQRSAGERNRLVLMIHGGPNMVYSTEFNLYAAVLALHGFSVAAVNYTGSLGVDEGAIRKLEGQIGTLDVADVMTALERLLEREALGIDGGQVYLMGGSHGGFICATLTAKFPGRFRACALRNPVIDLPSLALSSDIGDWPFGQLGLPFDLSHAHPATSEQLLQQHAASPSSLLHHVRTPTLLLLGGKDLRVPSFQGRSWHYWLRAQGVDTELVYFADAEHDLAHPLSERFSLEAIIDFFNTRADLSKQVNN